MSDDELQNEASRKVIVWTIVASLMVFCFGIGYWLGARERVAKQIVEQKVIRLYKVDHEELNAELSRGWAVKEMKVQQGTPSFTWVLIERRLPTQ